MGLWAGRRNGTPPLPHALPAIWHKKPVADNHAKAERPGQRGGATPKTEIATKPNGRWRDARSLDGMEAIFSSDGLPQVAADDRIVGAQRRRRAIENNLAAFHHIGMGGSGQGKMGVLFHQ